MKAKIMKLLNHANYIVWRVFTFTLFATGGFTAASFFSGCEDEREGDLVRRESGYLTFSVSGHTVIQTRAGTTARQEQEVRSLYVFLFNADNGNKESGTFYVEDRLTRTDEGYKVKLSDVTEGNKKVVAVANIIEDQKNTRQRLQVTKEQLDAINTLEELESLSASIVQNRLSASMGKDELFLMCTDVTELRFNSGDKVESQVIPMHRLAAKIEFRILESPGFTPTSWSVLNLPAKAYILRPATTESLPESDFFKEQGREFLGTGLGDRFIFYQQESLLQPQQKIKEANEQGYRQRALREKSGKDPKTNRAFKNAPRNATYVIIKGTYYGPRKAGESDNMVRAEVEYTIPLGYTDPADRVNDYNIERNTHYIYNIKVRGVDDIYVEAIRNDPDKSPDNERNPGVEGEVTAIQNYWEIDAHYEQRLLRITEEQVKRLDLDNIYCIVKTPFGSETFTVKDLMEQPDKYDALCDWVKFRQNSMTTKLIDRYKYYYKGTQDQLNRYPATGVGNDPITLLQFFELLRQNQQWSKEEYPNRYQMEQTIFSAYDDHAAFFTVYFDEYFYETNPLTKDPVHWSKSVNQPPRELIIALQKNTSVDQNSVYYDESLLAVRQSPIYTPYNPMEVSPYRAYGVESVNETGFVDLPNLTIPNDEWRFAYGWTNNYDYYNKNFGEWKSLHNGNWQDQRYNPNNRRYNPFDACLYRNRDLNRNGKIDVEEVRWYLPSSIQLINLAVGALGLPENVRLYQNQNKSFNQELWYVSSTPGQLNNNTPYFLWSEQGISIGNDWTFASGSVSDKKKHYNVRCVRTLGGDPGTTYDKNPMNTIGNKTKATSSSPAYMQLYLLNSHTQRLPGEYISQGEIPKHKFTDYNVLPYSEFYFAEKNLGPYTMGEIKEQLSNGTSPCASYSEKGITGWRMPSAFEMQLIIDIHASNELLSSPHKFFSSTWTETLDNLKCFDYMGGIRKFHVYNESDNGKEGLIRCVKDKR